MADFNCWVTPVNEKTIEATGNDWQIEYEFLIVKVMFWLV